MYKSHASLLQGILPSQWLISPGLWLTYVQFLVVIPSSYALHIVHSGNWLYCIAAICTSM